MENKSVLLICTAGITTGILVNNIRKLVEKENESYHIYSAPAIMAETIIKEQKIDALMIVPQVKYEIARLEEMLAFKQLPYRLIDNEDYEVLNAQAIYSKMKAML